MNLTPWELTNTTTLVTDKITAARKDDSVTVEELTQWTSYAAKLAREAGPKKTREPKAPKTPAASSKSAKTNPPA